MSKFQFLRKAVRFKQGIPVLLDRMANNAVYQFKVVNFDAKGFVDGSVQRWEPNKVQDGRQQLVKTGRMRQGIEVIRKTFNSRTIGNEVEYFKYHNEGTERLPQRKMVGKSKTLEIKEKNMVMIAIRKALKT